MWFELVVVLELNETLVANAISPLYILFSREWGRKTKITKLMDGGIG